MALRVRRVLCVAVGLGLFVGATAQRSTGAAQWRIDGSTSQLIVGIAESWNSSTVSLRRFEREAGGVWHQVGDEFAGRLGARGLVWGRGVNPRTAAMTDKSEGDLRAPAGVFALRRAFGDDPEWAARTKLRYVAVTTRDLFPEDPASPLYNTYVRLDHEPSTQFELKAQMNQHDPAHRLKIVIEHNTSPKPVAGKGSAILFHIWRADGAKPTAGCTAIAASAIETLLTWLDPARRPLYVLLPRSDYERVRAQWDLPPSF